MKNNPNEEVSIGDTITLKFLHKDSHCRITITQTIDEQCLKYLIDNGIVIVANDNSNITIDDVVKHLASRIKWKPENLDRYLSNLYSISPIATFQILLKEYAIMADKNYKDHISKVSRLWAISIVTGEVFEVTNDYKGKITNVALFRTREAAESARVVFKKAIEELF